MRLVLDTNTVVSALLWRGPPSQLIALAQSRPLAFFTTPVLLAELEDVLGRRKLAAAVAASDLTATQLMARYRNLCTVVPPAVIEPAVPADPDDNHVLAGAIAARAELIVSGDSDLLTLCEYQRIPILAPAAALRRIETA